MRAYPQNGVARFLFFEKVLKRIDKLKKSSYNKITGVTLHLKL